MEQDRKGVFIGGHAGDSDAGVVREGLEREATFRDAPEKVVGGKYVGPIDL